MEEKEGTSPTMAGEDRALRSPMQPGAAPESKQIQHTHQESQQEMQQSQMRHQHQHQPGLHEQHRDWHPAHYQAQHAQQSQVEQQSPGERQAQDGNQTHDNHIDLGFQPQNMHQQQEICHQDHEHLGSLSYTPQGDTSSFPKSPLAVVPPGFVDATIHSEVLEKLHACQKRLEDQKREMDKYNVIFTLNYSKLEDELEKAKEHKHDAEKQLRQFKTQTDEAWKKAKEKFVQQANELQHHREQGDRAEAKAQHLEDCLKSSSKEHEAERALRIQAQKEVAAKHKLWKEAASELRKSAIARLTPGQVSDEYLINEMQKLRYAIHNFAVGYFEGPPRDIDLNQLKKTRWHNDIATIFPKADWIPQYIMSNEKCPSVAQALLWAVLEFRVFGSFCWAGEFGKSLQAFEHALSPGNMHSDPETPSMSDTMKKYYEWRAKTVNLLLASMTSNGGQPITNEALKSWKWDCFAKMRYLIDPLLRKSTETNNNYIDDLNQILDQAFALEREMSVQASPVVLFNPDVQPSLRFKRDEMELEHGETLSTANQQVLLVVAPAMKRRGKSSGEEFDQERILLPMKVSCDPGTRHRMTRTAKAWGILKHLNLLGNGSSATP